MTTLERPRLLQQLTIALQTGHVLIDAPAGYGKTTLLQHLVRQRPGSIYVDCTAADIDLAHLQPRLQPHLHPGATLVVDDVHLLAEGPESLAWLRAQLDRDDLRLVVGGRQRLAWEREALTQLGADDLRFTAAEGLALLARQHTARSAQTLETWRQRLGGWPLGLQLLAQLAGSPNPLPVVQTHLFDYLVTAVFAALPASLQRFLLVTAVPLQFDDALACHLLQGNADAVALRQVVQQRNLFLEEAEQPGWFRYHDLIREALLASPGFDPAPLFEQTVRWFQERDELEMAIEHALAGGLQQTAAALILSLPHAFLNTDRRMLTYRRWVASLDEAVVDAHPRLLVNLGNFLHYVPGMQAEARSLLARAIALTENGTSSVDHLWARIYQKHIDVREGKYTGVPEALRTILDHPACTLPQRRFGLELLAMVFADQSRYREARQTSAALVALRDQIPEENLVQHRQNMAIAVFALLGDFEEAVAATQAAIKFYTDAPAWQAHSLLNLCELHALMGDWSALAATLAQVERLAGEVEVFGGHDSFWLWLYRMQLAVARDQLEAAEAAAVELDNYAVYDWTRAIAATAQTWLLRRHQMRDEAIAFARRVLPTLTEMPREAALLALEHDIALGFAWLAGDVAEFSLHPATKRLLRWRCRADLVRLRALLALVCWAAKNHRWRRHARAALYALRTYWGYGHLLTRRDPDLGAHFWPLVLIAGFDDERARAALGEIGQPRPVYPLLAHEDGHIRQRAADALAAAGREEALPALGAAAASEQEELVKAALVAAIVTLETGSPPPLRVQMLGGFRLWRGGKEVLPDAWSRPIVQRLFQYFALHRGELLARDRVLEELWPGASPDKAWATLRNVYSRLRSVLEPFAQSKGVNRYIVLDGSTYAVDPQDVMQVDVERFEQIVRQTLRDASTADIPPLPAEFLALLENYTPLLPEIPYEDWLLESRQRLADLYIDGALYAANALLIRSEPAQAERWARRALESAPWLEEAYAVLMRALARQGQRSAALRIYETAVAALKRELDAPPSPQTEWIAERLRQGKEI
ncbi:MAG: HEAT repeat domain-containing protein [Anaerolinea sp.]|nr:HEAT repeat domain-containing protein [Anaerolinea sp.]